MSEKEKRLIVSCRKIKELQPVCDYLEKKSKTKPRLLKFYNGTNIVEYQKNLKKNHTYKNYGNLSKYYAYLYAVKQIKSQKGGEISIGAIAGLTTGLGFIVAIITYIVCKFRSNDECGTKATIAFLLTLVIVGILILSCVCLCFFPQCAAGLIQGATVFVEFIVGGLSSACEAMTNALGSIGITITDAFSHTSPIPSASTSPIVPIVPINMLPTGRVITTTNYQHNNPQRPHNNPQRPHNNPPKNDNLQSGGDETPPIERVKHLLIDSIKSKFDSANYTREKYHEDLLNVVVGGICFEKQKYVGGLYQFIKIFNQNNGNKVERKNYDEFFSEITKEENEKFFTNYITRIKPILLNPNLTQTAKQEYISKSLEQIKKMNIKLENFMTDPIKIIDSLLKKACDMIGEDKYNNLIRLLTLYDILASKMKKLTPQQKKQLNDNLKDIEDLSKPIEKVANQLKNPSLIDLIKNVKSETGEDVDRKLSKFTVYFKDVSCRTKFLAIAQSHVDIFDKGDSEEKIIAKLRENLKQINDPRARNLERAIYIIEEINRQDGTDCRDKLKSYKSTNAEMFAYVEKWNTVTYFGFVEDFFDRYETLVNSKTNVLTKILGTCSSYYIGKTRIYGDGKYISEEQMIDDLYRFGSDIAKNKIQPTFWDKISYKKYSNLFKNLNLLEERLENSKNTVSKDTIEKEIEKETQTIREFIKMILQSKICNDPIKMKAYVWKYYVSKLQKGELVNGIRHPMKEVTPGYGGARINHLKKN